MSLSGAGPRYNTMGITTSIVKAVQSFLAGLGVPQSDVISEIIVCVCILASFILLGYIIYTIVEHYLTQWAKKTKTAVDDAILANIKGPIYMLLGVIGLYYSLSFLTVLQPYCVQMAMAFKLVEILIIAYTCTRVINVLIAWYGSRESKRRKASEHILFVVRGILNFIVCLAAFFAVLSILKIDLTGLMVGLGVGSLAIAFALQSVLSDAFSAFSIYFDRPFEIGDYIIVGQDGGTVKKIGMKSTRITLLQGEELVMPNSLLTSQTVRNFKKMSKRRICFIIGVTYGTPTDKLKEIPDMITKIIKDVNLATPDRVHFKEFADFSLNFEIVYYTNTKDYAKYMDVQQNINFGIREAFEKADIEMAFPTQTIYVAK